jgi:hypothetical protein
LAYFAVVNVSRLALISGLLFFAILAAGAVFDHLIEPNRSLQGSLERSAVFAGAIVVAIWLTLHVEGVRLR